MISDILSFQPGVLVQPADAGKDGQEKQPEHKVWRSAQKFIQFVTCIEKEERGNHNHKTPRTQHEDRSVHLAVLARLVSGS